MSEVPVEQIPLFELVEQWAGVPEAPAYEVSTHGRVRRGPHAVASWPNAKGYRLVSLEIPDHTLPQLRYVHRLVLSAFKGPAVRLLANHDNGRKGDNRLDNLEWTTPAGNVKHAYATGLIRPRPPRGTCRFGHPLDQAYTQRDRRGQLRQWIRCARCRRARAQQRRAELDGLRSLLTSLA